MTQKTLIHKGASYAVSKLSVSAQNTFNSLIYVEMRLSDAERKLVVLKEARSQCMKNLKLEIIEAQSGINLSELLGD